MLRTYQWRLSLAATSPSFVFFHAMLCYALYLPLVLSDPARVFKSAGEISLGF